VNEGEKEGMKERGEGRREGRAATNRKRKNTSPLKQGLARERYHTTKNMLEWCEISVRGIVF